jgi:hypothetical protein
MTNAWVRRTLMAAAIAATSVTVLGATNAPAHAAYYTYCNPHGCYTGHYYGPGPYWGYGGGWRGGWYRWYR